MKRLLLLAIYVFVSPTKELSADAPFLRGDANQNGRLEIGDAIATLESLFSNPRFETTCRAAFDTDGDHRVRLADALYTLNYLFKDGPRPPAPFPECNFGSSTANAECESHGSCATRRARFYGTEFEADDAAVVFVISRSAEFRDSGELAVAKNETICALRALREKSEFGVIFFDENVVRFPSNGMARVEDIHSGIAWIRGISGGSGSCPPLALSTGADLLAQSTASLRYLFVVSGTADTCAVQDAKPRQP